MKKFAELAMNEKNKKWKNSIKREEALYASAYSTELIRKEFDRDYTRVLNSNAYKRLKHKTQVFYTPENDHICTRIEHVNLVDSISYNIANFLGLNTELTRAISISHDLGHSPFGHQGEKVLSSISEELLGEKFWHEKNGLYYVENIGLLEDYNGIERNLNLTYAVRDGIISHCGEVDENSLKPREENISLEKYIRPNQYSPYTWEACVVKISDKISYIGRDIEDAIRMKILNEKDLCKIDKIVETIKISNSNIMNYLVTDICLNSNPEDGLKLSNEAFKTMNELKNYNMKKIYYSELIQPSIRYSKLVINEVFYALYNAFEEENTLKNLKKLKKYYPNLITEFIEWLSNYSKIETRKEEKYNNKILYDINKKEDYIRAILTYISGMTDNYIIKVYNELISF
ncbi:MAG: deoxyguanosinetriphosphate triphosphohydrolase family protein [Candidatus Scatovivens sp.]